MKPKKSVLVGGILAGVVLAGLIGFSASAQSTNGSTVVDKIAQRFNLNKADVQKVFDDNRTAKMADHEQKYEDQLNQAVKNRHLTTAQKDLILAKHKQLTSQMQSERDVLKDKSLSERHDVRQNLHNDIMAWEKQNNIPRGYLGGFSHGFRGHRFGHGA